MGNHAVGRAMVQTALALSEANTDLKPLEILDIACNPHRYTDAEFDDACWIGHPFGKLLLAAFCPGTNFESKADEKGHITTEEDNEWWDDNVLEPFSKRYDLC